MIALLRINKIDLAADKKTVEIGFGNVRVHLFHLLDCISGLVWRYNDH